MSVIRPRTRRFTPRPIAVLDLETRDLGGPFILGAYMRQNDFEVYPIYDLQKFLLDVLLTDRGYKYDWYAHNGARYDYLYFMVAPIRKAIIDRGFKVDVLMSRDRCVGIKITRGRRVWRLKDSYALTGLSLRSFASIFADQQKLEIDWSTETFDITNKQHIQYLKADVISTLQAIEAYQRLIGETFGVELGWTAASTSLKAWRQQIPTDLVYTGNLTYQPEIDLVKAAYYGGRTIVKGSHIWANVHGYDVNSMYAHAMLKGVPYGTSSRTSDYHPGSPGFYLVVAHSNGSTIPLLPKRDPERPRLVYFPLGDFQTTLSSLEIELAKEHGWTFDILDGYVWPEIGYPFTTFVEKCRDLRMQDYAGPLGALAKNMQNYLYGKLAQSPDRTAYMVSKVAPEDNKFGRWMPDIIPNRRHIKDIWMQEQVRDNTVYMPHWAAWITSQARVSVMRAAIAEGWDRVIYSDTDSLWLTGESKHLDVGPGYGQWKHQEGPVSMMILAPKTYMTSDGDTTLIRCKGLRKELVTPELLGKAFNNEDASVETIVINGMLAVLRDYGISWKTLRSVTKPGEVEGYIWEPATRTFSPVRLNMEVDSRQEDPVGPATAAILNWKGRNGQVSGHERHPGEPTVQAVVGGVG